MIKLPHPINSSYLTIGNERILNMKILIVSPGEIPCEKEINSGLKAMQSVVEGSIEAIYPFSENVAIVCNQDAKLKKLQLNRGLYSEDNGELYDIIAGTFFICGLGEDNFCSLPKEYIDKFKEKFYLPELPIYSNGKIAMKKVEVEEYHRVYELFSLI